MTTTTITAVASPNRIPFFALLAANAVSIIGNFMTLVALPWFVLETTGSATKTGLTAVAIALPQTLTGFFAGAIVDRLGYVRASVLADLAAGTAVALIPLLYHTTGIAFWQLLLIVFCGNLLNMAGTTGRQSVLPDVIVLACIPAARGNAWYHSVFNFAWLIGPLVAGIAIPVVGTSNVLWLDAATFALSALVVGLFVRTTARRAPRAATPYLAQLREGFRFIARDRPLMAVFGVAISQSVIGPAFFNVLLPLFAKERYGTAVALGLMRSGWGLGLLIGSLVFSAVADRLPRRATYFWAAAIGLAPFSLLVWGPPLAVSVIAVLAASTALGPIQPLRLTIQQERTPEGLRSRVFGTGNALQFAAAPVGTLLFSAIAQQSGVAVAIGAECVWWFAICVGIQVIPAFGLLEAQSESPEEGGIESLEEEGAREVRPATR